MIISHGVSESVSNGAGLRYVGLSGFDFSRRRCVGFGVAGMSPATGAIRCDEKQAVLEVGEAEEIELKMVLTHLSNLASPQRASL